MTRNPTLRLLLGVLMAFALLAAACGDDDDASAADDTTDVPSESVEDDTTTDSTADDDATTDEDPPVDETEEPDEEMDEPTNAFEGELMGVFALDPGACADGVVSGGSYFRMLEPGGTIADGPYIANFDSPCGDTTYTLLTSGADGGLTPGSHQPPPDPAFDADGNGLSAVITEPVSFFGVDFAAATDPTLDAVAITATDGALSGATTSFTAYYGGAPFNQGAPKPDGSNPGLTADPTGTIDSESGAFVLEWTSQIIGGAFNDFTGVWHFEGTFTAT
jgi:hypothetical protein